MDELLTQKDVINEQLARYGVKFGIYKNGKFNLIRKKSATSIGGG